MSANTYRLNSRDRAAQNLERSKPANTRRHPIKEEQSRLIFYKGWLAAVLLLPLGLITTMTLGEMLWRAMTRLDFWRSEQFAFFTVGGIAWTVAWLAGCKPVSLYVLGHELSHLLVARAFGGKIISWNFSAQGGYVETNKSNTWITLAPYLVPFYSVISMLVFGIIGLFTDFEEMHAISVMGHVVHLRLAWFSCAVLGLTWCFHMTYTVKVIVAQQSDLERNGEFFSLTLIFLFNVALIVALFLAASPAPGLGLMEVGRCWVGMAGWLWNLLFGRF